MTSPLARRWSLHLLTGGCLLATALAVETAAGFFGRPAAEAFVDPGGVVSNFGPPTWRDRGFAFPDQVVAVDGVPLVAAHGAPRADAWDRAVESAFASGLGHVDVTVATQSGVRRTSLAVAPLAPSVWWIYAGSLFFAAVLYAIAGIVALWASPESKLSRTFAKFTTFAGLMIATSFDFHTTRVLAPLFLLAFAMVPVHLVVLAMRLPDDVKLLRRAPWLEKALEAGAGAVAACLVVLHETGRSTLALQQAWTAVLGVSVAFFGVTLLARLVRAEGVRRDRLRALALSVVPPHVVLAAIAFPAGRSGALTGAVEALSYLTLSLFPIATAYAFIRYDLWGSRAFLSRVVSRIVVSLVAIGGAVGLSTLATVRLGMRLSDAFAAATFGGLSSVAVVLVTLRLLDRHVFASRSQYKPSVAQLSEDLIVITSPEEVARAVERTIRRFLPCDPIELSLAAPEGPQGRHGASSPPSADADRAAPRTRKDESGVCISNTPAGGNEARHGPEPGLGVPYAVVLPVEFGGLSLGTLRLGPKPSQALFTQDDLDLLRTIVNQGALALAHALAYQELEARRREQVAAFRSERAALVETVAAEIAHEVRYPINFFRSVFERRPASRPLDEEELELGAEEVARLERLVLGLRRLTSHPLDRRHVSVAALCDRVEMLLRDTLGDRRIERDVPDDAHLDCDPDQVLQVLINLVTNGLQAAGPGGRVGVSWTRAAGGVRWTVWDDGPGFSDPSRLFTPWYSTKPKGTGLGLAIAHRIVRAHGWNVAAERRGEHTEFVIAIRAEDVVSAARTSAPPAREADVA
jgi:two-component system, NtrC family, sensor histidine kinase HydH